jgi:hypothetical protein
LLVAAVAAPTSAVAVVPEATDHQLMEKALAVELVLKPQFQ